MNAQITMQVVLGMSLFTAIILVLVFVILAARSRLVSSGNVSVIVNEDKELKMPVGIKYPCSYRKSSNNGQRRRINPS